MQVTGLKLLHRK